MATKSYDAHIAMLLLEKSYGPAESCFAPFKEPGEATQRDALILEFWSGDIPAQVLNMDTVVGKQRIMGELVSPFRE